jgi:hypothetical protein
MHTYLGDAMKKYLWIVIIFVFLNACSNDSILQGISQDSSYDSKIEQASIDLDHSRYDDVILSLSVMYTTTALDPKVSQLLASAYMGKASVDLTNFLANYSSSGINQFDVMSNSISSPNVTTDSSGKYIAGTLIPDTLTDITKAKEILQVLAIKEIATNDDIVQLGFASATHFIFYLGNKTADALNETLKYPDTSDQQPGIVPVPLNTTAYKSYRSSDQYKWSNVTPKSFTEDTFDGTPTSYQEDLININNAVISFSQTYNKPNEMKDALNTFLHAALDVQTEVLVTDELIMTYTSEGLYDYVQRLSQ